MRLRKHGESSVCGVELVLAGDRGRRGYTCEDVWVLDRPRSLDHLSASRRPSSLERSGPGVVRRRPVDGILRHGAPALRVVELVAFWHSAGFTCSKYDSVAVESPYFGVDRVGDRARPTAETAETAPGPLTAVSALVDPTLELNSTRHNPTTLLRPARQQARPNIADFVSNLNFSIHHSELALY